MGNAVKLGDIGSGHGGFPPTPVVSGSSDVFINSRPAGRVGDSLLPHAKPKHPPHGRKISSGSSSVFINGKAAAFTGSSVSCGGVMIGGGSVTIGDKCYVEPKPYESLFTPPIYDRKIVFKDKLGNIISGIRYKLEMSNGDIVEGVSDKNGESELISSDNESAGIKVFIEV